MAKEWFVDQGSPEWKFARIGKPTASCFHKIITPTGAASQSRDKKGWSQAARDYMDKLIAERLLQTPLDDNLDRISWIERGKLQQPLAAAHLSEITLGGAELQPVGFITSDDDRLGCSPDMLVVGASACVEIKCPEPDTHVGYLREGPGTDYKQQVQGQLYVGGYECCHFFSWHERMPPVHIVTERDEAFIACMADVLTQFCDHLDAETERVRAMGTFVPYYLPRPVDPERAEYLQ